MRKKSLMLIGIILIILVSYSTMVYADPKTDLNLTTESKTIENGQKKLEIIISVGSFEEIATGGMLGYQANIDYDTNVFESVTFTGLNGWSTPTYDANTKKIISETNSAQPNVQICKMILVLKPKISVKNTTVSLKEVIITEGESQIKTQKAITFEVKEALPPPPTDDNRPEENTTPTQNITNTANETTNITTNKNTAISNNGAVSNNENIKNNASTLPHAGIEQYVLLAIAGILLLGFVFYIRYRIIKIH